jgi:uncharacterized protein involved in exopolysaccharide biosynthesis
MNRNRIFGFSAILVGFALCVVGLRLLLNPAEYQAVVKIEIEPDYGPGPMPYYPYFMETELMAMRGEIVLSNVVQSLNLNSEWGRRYGNGDKLGTDETIELLRRRISLDAERNTRLIDISVTEENPDEAAQIANAIAEAYRNYRMDLHRLEIAVGIEKLQETYEQETTNIGAMEANLQRLATESKSDPTNEILRSKDNRAKTELSNQEALHKLLEEKIEADKAGDGMPKSPLVTIVTPAVRPVRPVGPNRWMGATCVLCGLVITGCGLYSLRRNLRPGIA